jgi:hypothetical protein
MRWIMPSLLAILSPLAAYADLPKGEWATARPVQLPRMTAPGLVYLPLDEAALAAASLSEYRIARNRREEIPYRMVREEGQTETQSIPGKVFYQGKLGGRITQVIVDFASETPPTNKISLQLKGNNFRCQAKVEGSNDQKQWWLLDDKGLVYRHEGKYAKIALLLPRLQYRYLRITLGLLEGTLPQIAGVQAESQLTTPRKLVITPARVVQKQAKTDSATILDFDLGRLSRDLTEAEFVIGEDAFDRPVDIELSEVNPATNKEEFYSAAESRLRRLSAKQKVILPLSLPDTRRFRVVITNGNDRPLTIKQVELYRIRRGLIFRADTTGTYELWYGRKDAPQPEYDIARLPLPSAPANLPQARLGPQQAQALNPPPPPPWTERHPGLFWSILLLVLAFMGVLILRAMRKEKPGTPKAAA